MKRVLQAIGWIVLVLVLAAIAATLATWLAPHLDFRR